LLGLYEMIFFKKKRLEKRLGKESLFAVCYNCNNRFVFFQNINHIDHIKCNECKYKIKKDYIINLMVVKQCLEERGEKIGGVLTDAEKA